jgi:hypothetical protein
MKSNTKGVWGYKNLKLIAGMMVTFPSSPKLVLNKGMVEKKKDLTYEQCLGVEMSPAQNEVFLIIDEWWKRYHFSPTLRDITNQRGKNSIANTKKIVDRLCGLGVVKKLEGKRSIRPVYINFRNLE